MVFSGLALYFGTDTIKLDFFWLFLLLMHVWIPYLQSVRAKYSMIANTISQLCDLIVCLS